MASIVLTGCNRGIGFQLCKQFIGRGDDVIGVCRTSSPALEELGVRVIDSVDVSDGDTMPHLQESLGDQPVDVLVNNAGILVRDSLGALDYDGMIKQFQVNTLGPLRVTEALLGNFSEGSKVAIVSSRVGSIEDNASSGNYGYRASKTAVNQIGTNLKHDLAGRGIAVALLHPGFVATDMTGGQGISVEDSARGLIERIDELNIENSGGFWHAEGYQLPW